MLKYSFMDHANIHGLDIWNDGAIILVMNFHENFFLITLKEKSISSAILAYLHYLEELKVLSSSAGNSRYVVEKVSVPSEDHDTKIHMKNTSRRQTRIVCGWCFLILAFSVITDNVPETDGCVPVWDARKSVPACLLQQCNRLP